MKIKVLRNPARKHGLDPKEFYEGAVTSVDEETADKLIKLRIAAPHDPKKDAAKMRAVPDKPAVGKADQSTTTKSNQ